MPRIQRPIPAVCGCHPRSASDPAGYLDGYCALGTSPTTPLTTTSNCANAAARTDLTATLAYDVWSVNDIEMNWSGGAPAAVSVHAYVFNPGGWNIAGRLRGDSHCAQYYKLTSLYTLPGTGVVRGFFQADDLNPNSATSPFTHYNPGNPSACASFGAAPLFSGIFYADLTATKYGTTSVYTGDNYRQLYPVPIDPPVEDSCLTAGKANHCYAEFPLLLPGGTGMLVYANPTTPEHIVDQCLNLFNANQTPVCQTNFTTEIEQLLMTTDYSVPEATMRVTAATPWSTMQNQGTPHCQALLSKDGTTANCGIFNNPDGLHPSPLFGGCNHLNADQASGYVTCGNLTNFANPSYDFVTRRTMVFSLDQSPLNPVVHAVGPVRISGGASIRTQ